MLELEVIIDNNTLDENLVTEAGFSAYIRVDGKNILLDTGRNGNIIDNANKLGINLLNLDYIVFSHGHHDHTNGIAELIDLYNSHNIDIEKRPTVISHPDAFLKRYKGEVYIGHKIELEDLKKHFNVNTTSKAINISENLIFLGQIPRTNNFEAKTPLGNIIRNNKSEPDFIMDDTALAYKSKEGIVIISGCSHAGICNIIDYAKNICKDTRVFDIMGGLHLKNSNKEYIEETIEGIISRGVTNIHACHCTGEDAFSSLNNSVILQENIGCGYKSNYK